MDDLTRRTALKAGGATLGTKSVAVTGTVTAYKAAATTWTATGTLTARRAVVYKDTGSGATSPLLCSVLLDNTPANVSATDAAFTLTWDATDGVFKITAS